MKTNPREGNEPGNRNRSRREKDEHGQLSRGNSGKTDRSGNIQGRSMKNILLLYNHLINK
jgi:hypothetical protein